MYLKVCSTSFLELCTGHFYWCWWEMLLYSSLGTVIALYLLLCSLPSFFESTNNNHRIPIQRNFKFSALFSAGWFQDQHQILEQVSNISFFVEIFAFFCRRDVSFCCRDFCILLFVLETFCFCFFIGEILGFWLLLRLW